MSDEEHQGVVESTREALKNLLAHPVDEIVENPTHGSATLPELRLEVESAHSVSSELLSLEVSSVPASILQRLSNRASEVAATFAQIRAMTSGQTDFLDKRKKLSERLKQSIGPFHETAMTVVLLVTRHQLNVSEVVGELRGRVESLVSELKEQRSAVEAREKDAAETLERIKKTEADAKAAAKLVTVAKYSELFRDHAVRHGRFAVAWLLVTVAVFAGVGWFVYSRFVVADHASTGHSDVSANQGESTAAFSAEGQIARVSFSLLGLLFAGWSARNYRAHRHLATIERHRFAALNTFETFVKEADDPQIRDAVLLEAARCIYGHVATGYLGGYSDGPDNRIVEILKLGRQA